MSRTDAVRVLASRARHILQGVRPKLVGVMRRQYWPEVFVVVSWAVLLTAARLLFPDDESIGHHVMHLGLWLSAGAYLATAVRQHRMSS